MAYTRMFDGGLGGWLTIDLSLHEREREGLDELAALVKRHFDFVLVDILEHSDNPSVYIDIEVDGQALSLHSVTEYGIAVLAQGEEGCPANEETARRVADTVQQLGVFKGGGGHVTAPAPERAPAAQRETPTNAKGLTELMQAARSGLHRYVAELIRTGADLDQRATSHPGATALILAVSRGEEEVVQLLASAGADLDRGDGSGGDTPLIVAALFGHAAMVRILAAAGADVERAENRGDTPLFVAVLNAKRLGHTEAVRALVDAGADVNRPIGDGFTPLVQAARDGNEDAVSLLLLAGADPNQAARLPQGVRGSTPLMAAQKGSHTTVEHMLRQAGAAERDPGG